MMRLCLQTPFSDTATTLKLLHSGIGEQTAEMVYPGYAFFQVSELLGKDSNLDRESLWRILLQERTEWKTKQNYTLPKKPE